jgi:hypothetical protein
MQIRVADGQRSEASLAFAAQQQNAGGPPSGPVSGRRARRPRFRLSCGAGQKVRHTGIVFVHGIGSQRAGETLLDWGAAIERALADARRQHGLPADPVVAVDLDQGSRRPYVEVEPAPGQHWVMTEAWWASRIRPPSFARMAQWLGTGGAVEQIVGALVAREGGGNDPRLRPAVEAHGLRQAGDGSVEEDPGDAPGSRRGALGRWAGGAWSALRRVVTAPVRGLGLRAVFALVLVLYGLLRTVEKLVPVGPLKDGALTRPLDDFMLDWFGDVFVLLTDPVQSATVRACLVDALKDLAAAGCDRMVIVAHSGGAIVSYMTLTDPGQKTPVDRLITLGEGLNLAWRLVGRKGIGPGAVERDRLGRNVFKTHRNLDWDDFWASQDPAPVGVLAFPEPARPDKRSLARVRSHATWNRLSATEDHGGYWENDEEFLVPVLRLLEERPAGSSEASMFGDAAQDAVRSNRRRRRLSILALLRQACLLAPGVGLVAAFAIGSRTAFQVSDAVARVWSWIPGTKFVSDGLESLRTARPEDVVAIRLLAETGVWIVAAAIAAFAAASLLAPRERPIPWRGSSGASLVGFLLRIVPYAAGVTVLLVLTGGALKFLSGSTPSALDAGITAGLGALAVLIVGTLLEAFGRPWASLASGVVYPLLVLLIVGFIVVVSGLVVAPVVAVVVYPDVGRTLVGSVAVILVFQAIQWVGGWRWSVWDEREREAARSGRPYPGIGRVVGQVLLLAAILVAAFAAVVFESIAAAAVAGGGLVALVLVGVAIDVLDEVAGAGEPVGQSPQAP